MSESNIYFVPVEYSMLSEYLSSGFIGLTASKEPDSDIQSLGFPNVSIVDDLSDVAHEVCLEIEDNPNQNQPGFGYFTKWKFR
mgnify:CR=1 FL=1